MSSLRCGLAESCRLNQNRRPDHETQHQERCGSLMTDIRKAYIESVKADGAFSAELIRGVRTERRRRPAMTAAEPRHHYLPALPINS